MKKDAADTELRAGIGGVLFFVACAACSPRDLPDDQVLVSAHFRYHARSTTVVDSSILDRLEDHRTDFDAGLSVTSGLVDYYLFSDESDLQANSSCPDGVQCTSGRTVYTASPFTEHELVHALLHDTGSPGPLIAEGAATTLRCIQPVSPPAAPIDDWQIAARARDWPSAPVLYGSAQRLATWLIDTFGASRFVDYYSRAIGSVDPAIFALQFERTWGRSIGEVWPLLSDVSLDWPSCTCEAKALSDDGTSTSIVSGEEYRVVDVSADTTMSVVVDGPATLARCQHATPSPIALGSNGASPMIHVARLAPGRYAMTSAGEIGQPLHVTARGRPGASQTCEAASAAPIVVDDQALVTIAVDPALCGATSWFAFDLASPRRLLGASASVCDRCGDSSACRAADPNDPNGGVTSGRVYVALDRCDPSQGFSFSGLEKP